MNADDPNTPSLDELQRENEQLRASLQQSTTQLFESSREIELLHAQRVELLNQVDEQNREIDSLQNQVQMLLRRYFGRSSEKMDPRQRLLFEDFLDKAIPEVEPEDESESTTDASRKGHGRRRLPADLPREKIIHDLSEEEKPCPCCKKMRHIIGKETHEQLDYVPAKVKVIEHVRLKYGCPHCEKNASPNGPQIVVANKPSQPIEKGLAAPGLLSHIIVSKYGDHLPLNRLERILQRYGIDIARSTMCDWTAQCAEALKPLTTLMKTLILQAKVIHTDDTPVKVQDRNLDRTRTGRFWVYIGDATQPYAVFEYTPSRKRDGPMAFLRDWGKDERVFLQADAFAGYDGIYCGEAGGNVTEVACWAHARRKFYDARKSNEAASSQALAHIQRLYEIEKQAQANAKKALKQESKAHAGNASSETSDAQLPRLREYELLSAERYRLRQTHSVQRLDTFKAWLESQRIDNGGAVLPKSPMGQAIQYSLNHWAALCTYTTDGRLAIDNNTAERALRHVAIGRKNWLFAGSDKGGETAATLFSLIASCKQHNVNPEAYLRDALEKIASTPISQLATLLPDHWQAEKSSENS